MNSKLKLLHQGQALVASIPAASPDYISWLGIYPLDLQRATTLELLKNHGQVIPAHAVPVYRIRRFDVAAHLIEKDISLCEGDLMNKMDYFAYGEDDLSEKLMSLNVLWAHLKLPWQSDYPI